MEIREWFTRKTLRGHPGRNQNDGVFGQSHLFLSKYGDYT
jgi:hypothetical protein